MLSRIVYNSHILIVQNGLRVVPDIHREHSTFIRQWSPPTLLPRLALVHLRRFDEEICLDAPERNTSHISPEAYPSH